MTGVRGDFSGIGMTSERTRARMVERLRNQGIADEHVLAAMAAAAYSGVNRPAAAIGKPTTL